MSQSTLDDDDLFGEAATDLREDVEEHLEAAYDALPDADAVWTVEADNTLGVLNALRTALDAEVAREHYRDARKWYTMGERADAFEDADDLREDVEELEELLESIETAREEVGELAATLPELRESLSGYQDGEDGGESGDGDED